MYNTWKTKEAIVKDLDNTLKILAEQCKDGLSYSSSLVLYVYVKSPLLGRLDEGGTYLYSEEYRRIKDNKNLFPRCIFVELIPDPEVL